MPVRVEGLVLPGTELEPVPLTSATPVVIRIDAVYRHGTALRYDLVYQLLEPGDYNLADYLRRKDRTSTADLPKLPARAKTLLAPGQIEPHALSAGALPWLGGYRLLLVLAGVVWTAILLLILFYRRRHATAQVEYQQPRLSLSDRLRPLVNDAMSGHLAPARLAELERALVSYWRRRLGLSAVPPQEAIATLREHPEASPLILQLETWLHRPGGASYVDVNALLEPYQDLPPDELEHTEMVAGSSAQ